MELRNFFGLAVLLIPLGHTQAAETDVGIILEQGGAAPILVQAGEAIRATCNELGASVDSLTATQAELFDRCRDMSNTVTGGGNSLGYLDINDTYNALRQFAGEEVSTQGRFATETTNRQFANIGARMDAIRLGARALSSGLAVNLHGVDVGSAMADSGSVSPLRGGGASADADTGWGWFTNGSVGFGDRDRSVNESAYDYDVHGITVGTDYVFASGLAVGMAVGYSSFSADLERESTASIVSSSSGGKIDSDGYSISAFFVRGFGQAYVNGIASYGWNDFDLSRRARVDPGPDAVGRPAAPGYVIDRSFTASTDSTQLAAQFTGGMLFGEGPTSTEVYFGVDYLKIDIDGYTERERDNAGLTSTPGLALRFADQDIDSVQSMLGITVRRSVSVSYGVLIPYIGAEWRHEFENRSRTLDYGYAAALSNISFRTPSDAPDQDFFDVSLGLSAQFANNLFGFVQYNTSLALDRATTNLVSFGLRGVF